MYFFLPFVCLLVSDFKMAKRGTVFFYFAVNTLDAVPVPEDNEIRRNGTLLNLNCDQLHEKLKLATQREKRLKVCWLLHSVRVFRQSRVTRDRIKVWDSVP